MLVGAPVWDARGAQQRIQEGAASYDENDMPLPRTAAELKAATTFTNPRPEWVEKTNELRTQAGTWVRKTSESLAWYDILARLPLIKAAATLVLNGEHDHLRDFEDILYNNIPNASKGRASGPGSPAPGGGPRSVCVGGA